MRAKITRRTIMCVPLCEKMIREAAQSAAQQHASGRRKFMALAGAAAAAGAAVTMAHAVPAAADDGGRENESAHDLGRMRFGRVVDLTHTITPTFPTFSNVQQIFTSPVTTLANDGYNILRWDVQNEHTGTHMDAPFHFSNGLTADAIPVQNLVGALAIIDITARAAANADAEVTPEDVRRYERRYGRIKSGAIVAMRSGWDAFVTTPKFRNADSSGVMHFPGFHVDAASLLIERGVKGILVDTLSLDNGVSTTFATHFKWLPSNRWGIECAANLGQLPARGAVVVVGGPKIQGASGGPSRVIALA
jgi:kynurenine formamidase